MRIFSKEELIWAALAAATPAASSCPQVPWHEQDASAFQVIFPAGQFDPAASQIPVLQQGGRKTQGKWDSGTAPSVWDTFSCPPC